MGFCCGLGLVGCDVLCFVDNERIGDGGFGVSMGGREGDAGPENHN